MSTPTPNVNASPPLAVHRALAEPHRGQARKDDGCSSVPVKRRRQARAPGGTSADDGCLRARSARFMALGSAAGRRVPPRALVPCCQVPRRG
jgi:hypothetical protein